MNFSFGRNVLKKAIERGLANGKIDTEIRELGDLQLKSRSDAEAVCWGLEQLHGDSLGVAEQTYALARLFQEIEDGDCAAVEVLRDRGISELLRLFEEIRKTDGDDKRSVLLFVLKIFALYATTEGTLKIIQAAQQALYPQDYMWSVILGNFQPGHPQNDLLYSSLSEPLPPDFVAISLLDAANHAIIGGETMSHPFDSSEGKVRLKSWLTNEDDEEYSYAHSATAALPFISNPERDLLLGIAMKHPDLGVRLEALWAAAKLGREDGFQGLAEHCRDFKSAAVAKKYLTELGREDVIPFEAKDASFSALAEFGQWCAHPNELARMPDELEIVDHRELHWPPEREPKPFWLIKYVLRGESVLEEDQVGCGLVGSVTFCLFSYQLEQRPPEDGYAIHCYWEMESDKLIEETDIEPGTSEYDGLLKQWQGPALSSPSLLVVAELSPELKYPQRLVGVASASLNSELGWVVLDGDRSRWYARADMLSERDGPVVLKIHVGSQLLGLIGERDRKKYFAAPQIVTKSAEQIIAAYEALLIKAKRRELKARRRAYADFGPLQNHLAQYTEALMRTGRASEVRPVIQLLMPHWESATGFGELGKAAWKAGQLDLAEELFLKLRDQTPYYQRSEEMDLLAELWCRRGRTDTARELLLDCLHRLLQESKTAKGDDKRLFENWFQTRRAAFLRLFSGDGGATLAANGIPSSSHV